MERGDLLICNHALFCSDLVLRSRGAGFLPAYDHVILDEAHGIEDVATDHFGVSLAEGRVQHLLTVLFHARSGKGFLGSLLVKEGGDEMLDRAIRLVHDAREGSEALFARISDLAASSGGSGEKRGEKTLRFRDAPDVDNTITSIFSRLGLQLRRLREVVQREEDAFELVSYA